MAKLWHSKNLEQQLVLGEALDWFEEVGVEAQLVIQLLLALLQKQRERKKEEDRVHRGNIKKQTSNLATPPKKIRVLMLSLPNISISGTALTISLNLPIILCGPLAHI